MKIKKRTRAVWLVWAVFLQVAQSAWSEELPKELPLWEKPPQASDVEEKLRSRKAPGSPTGMNRAFSSVSLPTYAIHRPEKPNGVGLVICPGGGFRDIWIDREGHDLAIWLKDRGVTCLVLKYRTRPADLRRPNAWKNYQEAVRSDARQAIRILRKNAVKFGLKADRIGICGFSAGGHLAISTSLAPEPEPAKGDISGMPDFAGLFYPGIPDEAAQWIENRGDICPMFIVNARVDKLTPAPKCVDFYARLLKAGVDAELHLFSKGGHGFGMGQGRGKSTALWPTSFAAWLCDIKIIDDGDGLPDFGEYVFGGNPTNGWNDAAKPVLDAAAGNFIFSLIGDSNVVAYVGSRTNLLDGAWATNETVYLIANDGVMGIYTNNVDTSEPRLFIKLMLKNP